MPGLQLLNPNVVITADTGRYSEKPDTFWGSEHFDIVIATDVSLAAMADLNAKCRVGGAYFFGAAVDGFVGMSFADLGKHDYIQYVSISFPKSSSRCPTMNGVFVAASAKQSQNQDRRQKLCRKREQLNSCPCRPPLTSHGKE